MVFHLRTKPSNRLAHQIRLEVLFVQRCFYALHGFQSCIDVIVAVDACHTKKLMIRFVGSTLHRANQHSENYLHCGYDSSLNLHIKQTLVNRSQQQ